MNVRVFGELKVLTLKEFAILLINKEGYIYLREKKKKLWLQPLRGGLFFAPD